jgi:hypothetical protein
MKHIVKVYGLLLILILTSCVDKRRAIEEKVKNYEKSGILYKDNQIVFSDSFADSPLEITSDFKEKYKMFNTSSDTVLVQGELVNVSTFTSDKDLMKIYETSSEIGLSQLELTSNKIVLQRGIRIGMKKTDVYKAFLTLDTIRDKKDEIVIMGGEESLEFFFKGDTLFKIKFGTRVH